MTKTGIFGGSFNPIHNGHIALARQLLERGGLDEVWLMVSPQNPLKQQSSLASDHHRLQMARLALKGIEGVKASDYEMHLPLPSYTWHTLQALSRDFPERSFALLMGGDNWDIFNRWYHYEDILRNYQIIIYPRSNGTNTNEGVKASEDTNDTPFTPRLIDAELLDISSTAVRAQVKAGRPIEGMVPAVVADYIAKHNLYI